MSPEVRRAALRTAAKATFIVSVGCSNVPPPAAPAEPATAPVTAPVTVTTTAPATCGEYLDGLARVDHNGLAASDPLRERADVYGAFVDVTARSSERTQQCCLEELQRDSSGAAHRWACCSALAPQSNIGSACSPWGPPCPPELLT